MSVTAVPDLSQRTDYIPREDYICPDFARGEKERLWPRVWLMACREEDLDAPGKFVTFNIADESIIINRDEAGAINAFFNVCPHRGRSLTKGCGKASKFFCPYHGWSWNLDGSNEVMIDGEQWTGIAPADIGLRTVRHDTWGGFVFVNIDGQAEPLLDWLEPVVKAWGPYRLETMRYRWFKTTKLDCNWKVALEAFLEGYHAQTTHRQVNNADGGSHYDSRLFGAHSMFYPIPVAPFGMPNPNSKYLPPINAEAFEGIDDRRTRIYLFMRTLADDLQCMYTERLVEAARRLPERVSADASSREMTTAMLALEREISAADGVDLSHLTNEEYFALGTDWNLFPNIAILPTLSGVLVYRARPDGDDPDKCLFDILPLERYAPGKAPQIQRETYDDWHDGNYARVFAQDFANVGEVQRGMKSAGFPGALPNPMAEKVIWNLHRELRERVLGETEHPAMMAAE